MGQNYSTKIVGWNSEIGIDLDFPINLRNTITLWALKSMWRIHLNITGGWNIITDLQITVV